MASSRSHDTAANKIAKLLGTTYSGGPGVDINTPSMAIEVETPGSIYDGIRQLQGFRKPVYIAGANQEAVKEALKATEGTTIGVMDRNGNILRPSMRGKGK